MSNDKAEETVPKIVDEYTRIPEDVKIAFSLLVSVFEEEMPSSDWMENGNKFNNIIRRMKGEPTLTKDEDCEFGRRVNGWEYILPESYWER